MTTRAEIFEQLLRAQVLNWQACDKVAKLEAELRRAIKVRKGTRSKLADMEAAAAAVERMGKRK